MTIKQKISIPPVKCQGIKSKLVPWILDKVRWDNKKGLWIEPFMGSGVVGFNMAAPRALFCDVNPHVVHFYQSINSGKIDAAGVREVLEAEADLFVRRGAEHYYLVRERFNESFDPMDFLILNRSCFNGVIRFNRDGRFNVPWGHKPRRFSKAYISKIVNQVSVVQNLCKNNDWRFVHQDYADTLLSPGENDFVYCDPPYVGRHVDYYNGWTEKDEINLYRLLNASNAPFILSTWYGNRHRHNPFIEELWSAHQLHTREHFYHVGARESNRAPMIEALITGYRI